MLAGKENTFKVGDSADSQTHLASSQIHKFMDKSDSVNFSKCLRVSFELKKIEPKNLKNNLSPMPLSFN